MRTAVNALARYHACLRAQIDLMPAAETYVEQWEKAMEKREMLPPYEDYFRDAAYAVRVPILDDGPFSGYLEGCADDWRLPDPARIVQAIVHAHAEQHLIFDKRCGCPARQMLLAPVREEDGQEDYEESQEEEEQEEYDEDEYDEDEDEEEQEEDEEDEDDLEEARLDE